MDGDTVTVFDTARAAAIALLTESRYQRTIAAKEGWERPLPEWVRERCREMATEDIDLLLAARSSTTCEECKGYGFIEYNDGASIFHEPCGGSGTVPGGPLILLAPEKIGSWSKQRGLHWADDDDPSVPVFVARESFEENPE